MMLAAIRVVLGLALLFLGRRLFWLFVGAVGFALGAFVATQLIEAGNVLTILIALGGGLVGILLALFLQSLAIGLAGFVAGALILQRMLELVGLDIGSWSWVILIIGGIIGWLGSIVMKTDAQMGIIANVIVGIIGAGLGGWLAVQLGIGGPPIMGWVMAVVGAVVLIAVLKMLGIFR